MLACAAAVLVTVTSLLVQDTPVGVGALPRLPGTPATLNWTELNNTSKIPPRRSQASMSYDGGCGCVVMFGGENDRGPNFGPPLSNQTWLFKNNVWKRGYPTTSPPARRGAMLAWDPVDNYLVLFGGSNLTGYLNDTWVYQNTQWREIFPAHAPSVRRSAGFTYDPKDGYLLLYGGHAGGIAGPPYTFPRDTWTFLGGNWTKLSVARTPPGTAEPFFGYDPTDSYVVMFGGYDEGKVGLNGSRGLGNEVTYNTTWTFVGGVWTNRTASLGGAMPSWRDGGDLLYIPPLKGMLLYGGDYQVGPLPDEWLYSHGSWSLYCAACAPPSRATDHGAWDYASAEAVTFGPGFRVAGKGQTWVLA